MIFFCFRLARALHDKITRAECAFVSIQVFAKSPSAKQKHIFVLSHHLVKEALKRHVTIHDVLICTNNIQMQKAEIALGIVFYFDYRMTRQSCGSSIRAYEAKNRPNLSGFSEFEELLKNTTEKRKFRHRLDSAVLLPLNQHFFDEIELKNCHDDDGEDEFGFLLAFRGNCIV